MITPLHWLQLIGGVCGGGVATTLAAVVRDRRKTRGEALKFEAEAQHTLNQMVDERLQMLIDGYERRIVDLTDEVRLLRAEIVELRRLLFREAPSRLVSQTGLDALASSPS